MTNAEALQKELLEQTPKGDRCPHLRVDSQGPWCSHGNPDGANKAERRIVCDNISLQLWCLDKDRFKNCLFFQNPEEFHDDLPDLVDLGDPRRR